MIKKEENGTWSVRCWYRDWRGDRKQKTKRGFLKQKDAKAWEREFLAMEQQRIITMDMLIQSYLGNLKKEMEIGKIRESTYDMKKGCIERYIKPYYKEADVSNVDLKVINDWVVWLSSNFGRGQLSSNTIKYTSGFLSQIFDYGVKFYGLKVNPAKQIEYPKGVTSDTRAKAWDINTFNTFYNSIRIEHHKVIFNLLYWSGLRIGEILGITPDDVLDHKVVVNKQWRTSTTGRSSMSEPKNKSSYRTVVIPDFIYKQLVAYIDGIDGVNPTDRIFPIQRITVYRFMKKCIKKLGLPNASPHTMRHSYATNFIAESKDYVAASAQLGHSSARTTLGIYAHAQEEAIQNSVDLLEKLHEK